MFDGLPASYDDWRTASPPAAEPCIAGRCEFCAGDLYEGDEAYLVNDVYVEPACFEAYAKWALDIEKVMLGEEDVPTRCICCDEEFHEGYIVLKTQDGFICEECLHDWAEEKLKAHLVNLEALEMDDEGDEYR